MFKSKPNWKQSPPHLLLLSKFLSLRTPDYFVNSRDTWNSVLGEDVNKAIKRFLDEGVIRPEESLEGAIEYRFKVSEIKEMLKKRGLTTSGNKADLTDRLVEADPIGMKQTVVGIKLVKCSEEGRIIAEQYLAFEQQKREEVEKKVVEALNKRQFLEAARLVATFEAQQVFSRGMGVDWKKFNPETQIRPLQAIFNSKPKILKGIDEQQLNQLRIAAALMSLWGVGNVKKEWVSLDFNTGLVMDNNSAARMIIAFISNQGNLNEYKRIGVKKVKVESLVNDDLVCKTCRSLNGTVYSIDKVPEIPYEGCTSVMGCRCSIRIANPRDFFKL